MRTFLMKILMLVLSSTMFGLAACGGGGSSSTTPGTVSDTGTTTGTEVKILNQTSTAGVSNNPPTKSTFSLSGTTRITKILTYHWNGGNGDSPGTLSLINTASGTVYGPWTAIGNKTGVDFTPGATWPTTASGPPYIYWLVQPNVDLPAGNYELVDSKPASWSYTSDIGNKGYALVYGTSPGSTATISKTYIQGDMVGKTVFYTQLSESVAKTSGALLQAILTVNSFLFTDFSSTSIETFRARKLEADKALDTLVKYAAETETLIAVNSQKQAALTALSPEDVLATIASGPSSSQIKTLMNTYGVNAKKAQLILNTAMAGLESTAWTDLAAVENKTLQTATLVKNGAALTLTIAGTVVTAGGVTGAVGVLDAGCAIISGVDGVIQVTQSGMELAIGKEITLPDGSKASMIITTLSAVSDIISFKDLPKLVNQGMKTSENIGNVYTVTSKIVDGLVSKTITFGPAKVDIRNGLSIGSSVDLGYITGLLGGLINAPSTMPGTYKVNGVTTVVSTLPATMTQSINVLPTANQVDPVKIAGTTTPTPTGTRFIFKANGTVYDTVYNLTWLNNLNCFGGQTWDAATASTAKLTSGQCGLADGSSAGSWRLPTSAELLSIARADISAFINYSGDYWSSDVGSTNEEGDWHLFVDIYSNKAWSGYPASGGVYAWPVHSGK